jgi:hypothetical protein
MDGLPFSLGPKNRAYCLNNVWCTYMEVGSLYVLTVLYVVL